MTIVKSHGDTPASHRYRCLRKRISELACATCICETRWQGRVCATKVLTSPQGIPPFYRIAEIHFSLMQDFEVCAALDRGKQLVAEAVLISSGGPPIFSVSGEETLNSSKWPVFTSRRIRGPIWPIRCDSAYVSEIGQSAKPNWTKQTTEETELYD